MVLSFFLLLQVLVPAATVKVNGRVTVEGNAPFPTSFTLQLAGGGPAPAGANRSLLLRTQIDGTFPLALPPGEYSVGTPGRLPPGYTVRSMVYRGVDLLHNPLKITSEDSAELVINLTVNGPPPTVSVSGHVTGLAPGQIKRISLREASGGDLSASLETTIGADGAFTFPKVLPGNYIVYMRLLSQTPVIVGNKDVTDLVVAFPQEILVSAHVIAEGVPTPPPTITLEGKGPVGTTQSRGSGSFVLGLGMGENSISVVNIPDAYRLKSMTYGDVDLQKGPLKLDGPATWDIIVRLSPKN
jgi:hypothetical protein